MAAHRWYLALATAATGVAVIIATVVLMSDETPESAPAAVLEPPGYELTSSASGGGSVSLEGASQHEPGATVTLTAHWPNATHTFEGWSGDCSGTGSTCALTMDADKTVQANFEPRCPAPDDPGCVVAVYQGAPDDYATVAEIPAEALIEPDAEGRYRVRQGRQITVITTASLPAGATDFELRPPPSSLRGRRAFDLETLAPVGATFTFTVRTHFVDNFSFALDLTATSRRLPAELRADPAEEVVSVDFFIEEARFRYSRLVTDRAPEQRGHYAFRATVGNGVRAIDRERWSPSAIVELRIHPTDASGVSRADFYDGVQVGDRFDYRPNGFRCSFRFEVTGIGETSVPRSLQIKSIRSFTSDCRGYPAARVPVTFVWGVTRDLPNLTGIRPLRQLRRGEPAGEGTYLLVSGLPYLMDVPAGIEIIYRGWDRREPHERAPFRRLSWIVLEDAETGALLYVYPDAGTGQQHTFTTRAVYDAFGQILASLRLAR